MSQQSLGCVTLPIIDENGHCCIQNKYFFLRLIKLNSNILFELKFIRWFASRRIICQKFADKNSNFASSWVIISKKKKLMKL